MSDPGRHNPRECWCEIDPAKQARTQATLSGDDTAGSSEHNMAASCLWEVVNSETGDRASAESLEAIVLASRTLVEDHVHAGGDRRSARLGATVLRGGLYHGEGTRLARAGWSL